MQRHSIKALDTKKSEVKLDTASALEPGSLYVMLDLRSPDLSDTTFHWALYLHKANEPYSTGHKYHIKTVGDGWMADHAPMSGVRKSFLLVCLIRVVKDIPTERWQEVGNIVTSEDQRIHEGDMTCRIWVMQALARLRDAAMLTWLDMSRLEEEVKRIGNQFRESAVKNEQPRPIVAVIFTASSCQTQ